MNEYCRTMCSSSCSSRCHTGNPATKMNRAVLSRSSRQPFSFVRSGVPVGQHASLSSLRLEHSCRMCLAVCSLSSLRLEHSCRMCSAVCSLSSLRLEHSCRMCSAVCSPASQLRAVVGGSLNLWHILCEFRRLWPVRIVGRGSLAPVWLGGGSHLSPMLVSSKNIKHSRLSVKTKRALHST